MDTSKDERSKPHGDIGTIGYIAQGKTTLMTAIVKTLSERVCVTLVLFLH